MSDCVSIHRISDRVDVFPDEEIARGGYIDEALEAFYVFNCVTDTLMYLTRHSNYNPNFVDQNYDKLFKMLNSGKYELGVNGCVLDIDDPERLGTSPEERTTCTFYTSVYVEKETLIRFNTYKQWLRGEFDWDAGWMEGGLYIEGACDGFQDVIFRYVREPAVNDQEWFFESVKKV